MDRLKDKFLRIDGKGYKAYKDIQGTYSGDGFLLHIDYVQGDPFAGPSRIRVETPQDICKFKEEWFSSPHRRTAFEDFLTRSVSSVINSYKTGKRGTGNSGLVYVDCPGQEVLPRTSVKITPSHTEFRLSVGLPANGRTIMGKQAVQILCHDLPQIVMPTILEFKQDRLVELLELADQQETIRTFLDENRLVCFVANGSILPRESGISNNL